MATVRKKVDNRIRVQIENGVALQHRTIFVVVGDRGRDQVILPSLSVPFGKMYQFQVSFNIL